MNVAYPKIFAAGKIGTLGLKNRIIFAPTETKMATVDGQVTQRLIDYYVRRAVGGAGLLVVHSTQACTKLDPIDPYGPSLRMDDIAYGPMMYELTDAIHRAGGKVSLLLTLGGGAQSVGFPYDRGLEGLAEIVNVSPGNIRCGFSQRPLRQLTVEEIEKMVGLYGIACARAQMAGFDAVTIHGWGGYLLSQFLSPYFNDRNDKYGGDFDRRLRFALELIDSCRKQVGSNFPLIFRISIDEYLPNGRSVEDSIHICKKLEAAGIDAIDACAGTFQNPDKMFPSNEKEKGVWVNLAEKVKCGLNIPVITQGRIIEPQMAEDILEARKADFIAMARGLIADPDWVNKLQKGREKHINRCICCLSCLQSLAMNRTIRCAINPTVGREDLYRTSYAETNN